MKVFLKVFAEPVQNYVSINNTIVQIFQDAVEITMNFWIYRSIKTTSQKNEGFGKDQTFLWQYATPKCLEPLQWMWKIFRGTSLCALDQNKRQRVFPKNSPCVWQPLVKTEERL